MFTIEVTKKKKDEEFNIKELEMFHRDCQGGKIEVYNGSPSSSEEWLTMTCKRCGVERSIELTDENRLNIVKVIIKGGEVKFKDASDDEERITLVPKEN